MPIEIGTEPTYEPGKRTDLLAVKEDIDNGMEPRQLWDNHFTSMVMYSRGIDRYLNIVTRQRNWKTNVFVMYGSESGTGKSLNASMFDLPEHTYYLRKSNGENVWWDGYTNQRTVVLDDFYGWIPWSLLLHLADRYPTRVDTKGGSVNFVAKTLIITSNKGPEGWYPKVENKQPLYRRIDGCWLVTKTNGIIREDGYGDDNHKPPKWEPKSITELLRQNADANKEAPGDDGNKRQRPNTPQEGSQEQPFLVDDYDLHWDAASGYEHQYDPEHDAPPPSTWFD